MPTAIGTPITQWYRHGRVVYRRYGPPLNFITLHYAYFIITSLVSAVVLWVSSTPSWSLSFVDALFLTVSAISCAGLNTVNLSGLNTFQQVVLFALIMLGSVILVSAVVIYVRKAAFESRFAHLIKQQKADKIFLTRRRTSLNRHADEVKDNVGYEPETDGLPVRGDSDFHAADIDSSSRSRLDSHPLDTIRRPACLVNVAQSRSSECAIDDISLGSNDKIYAPAGKSVQLPTLRFANHGQPDHHRRVFSFSGVGARDDLANHPRTAHSCNANEENGRSTSEPSGNSAPDVNMPSSFRIGRNSQFSSLTAAERDKLGGVEYRALKLLGIVVPAYYILFQLFGSIALGAWVTLNAPEIAINNGLNPWWSGSFNAISAFNNSGMSLIDANMVAFQWSYYMMITMGMLILVGNTCFPVILRLIFWTLWSLTPSSEAWRDTKVALRFILDHPRRVYTNLFPSSHTWFLLGTIITLNAIDWLGFEILNIGNPYVESLPSNLRVIDGLFQATAVRSGGFYVVPIANIAIAVQVLYVLMMYISVYPVTMTMRNSNVYEERSLGIYAGEDARPKLTANINEPQRELQKTTGLLGHFRQRFTNTQLFAETGTHSRSYFIKQQLRSQLAHDLWWICLAVFFIMIIEGKQFATDPVAFSVFNVLFEVVSGYGTVGISVGLPNQAYSFCGGWHALSKLILCAVMLRGRHRGLPVAIDRAVLLPHEHLADAEEEDAKMAVDKTFERPSTALDPTVVSTTSLRARPSGSRSDQIV